MNRIDNFFINFSRKWSLPFARFALFVVFFWFGVLKVVGESPASPLVSNLLSKTMPFVEFNTFIIFFGLFEMLIGILFLIPKFWRVAVAFLSIHMITTFLPLIFVPAATWSDSWIPTLEGQYIIKNLVIIATALAIVSHVPAHSENVRNF